MKKQTSFLFTKDDEIIFCNELKKVSNHISFLDNIGNHYHLTPLERKTLVECESSFVGIWNKELFPVIEKYRTAFIYMNRSNSLDPTSIIPKNNFLSSGDISIIVDQDSYRAEEMKIFVKEVWKILQKISSKRLTVVSLETGQLLNDKPLKILAGHNAIKWCQSNPNCYFKFRSVQVYMKPL